MPGDIQRSDQRDQKPSSTPGTHPNLGQSQMESTRAQKSAIGSTEGPNQDNRESRRKENSSIEAIRGPEYKWSSIRSRQKPNQAMDNANAHQTESTATEISPIGQSKEKRRPSGDQNYIERGKTVIFDLDRGIQDPTVQI